MQTKYQHHQAGLEMEPTGEEEEREAKKQRRRSVEGEMREAGFKAERDGQTSLRT